MRPIVAKKPKKAKLSDDSDDQPEYTKELIFKSSGTQKDVEMDHDRDDFMKETEIQ